MLDKTIECDNCNNEMKVQDVTVKDEAIIDNRIDNRYKRFWNCTQCNHEYLITITNRESRAIAKHIEADAKELKSIINSAQYLVDRKRMTNIQMKRNLKKTEEIGDRMKVNRDKLDGLQRKLTDEHKKEMQQT